MEWKEDFSSRLYRNSCKSNATKKNRNIDLSILPLFSTFQIVREKKKIKGKKKSSFLKRKTYRSRILDEKETRRNDIYIYIRTAYIWFVYFDVIQRNHRSRLRSGWLGHEFKGGDLKYFREREEDTRVQEAEATNISTFRILLVRMVNRIEYYLEY